jgi:hypothetical protein
VSGTAFGLAVAGGSAVLCAGYAGVVLTGRWWGAPLAVALLSALGAATLVIVFRARGSGVS